MSAVIRSLPLFPLDVVLFPHERLPLHIFEERYKAMMQYCTTEDEPFGVILSEEDEDQLAEVGCTARVDRVLERYEDGRLNIMCRGEERFRLLQLYFEEEYPTADVERWTEHEPAVSSTLKQRVITQHMKLLEIVGRQVRPSLYEDVPVLSYSLAQNAGLSLHQKQEVLELPTEEERVHYLVEHLQRFLPEIEEQEALRRRIQSNGHFKDFPPEELE